MNIGDRVIISPKTVLYNSPNLTSIERNGYGILTRRINDSCIVHWPDGSYYGYSESMCLMSLKEYQDYINNCMMNDGK